MSKMSKIIVASYNMSFLNDLVMPLEKAQWASEATFLASNKTGDRRAFWKNAADLLLSFLKKNGPRCVVGLQEMNLVTAIGSNTGSDAINNMLARHFPNYIQVCREIVVNANQKPALSILFNPNEFGNVRTSAIFDNPKQAGRPLLIVITDQNYVFANMHGAQDPSKGNERGAFNKSIRDLNVSFLENTVSRYVVENGLSPEMLKNRIFIMGDFNDRYDGISQFTVLGKDLNYRGMAPYSCCNSWVSTCSKSRFTSFGNGYGICTAPGVTVDDKGMKIPMNGEEANTKNYRFKGDKLYGETPVTSIKMFAGKNGKGDSIESDHQLVYATYSTKVGKSTRANRSVNSNNRTRSATSSR
uniref:Endonuclease/exonuclease/phosphatase domain-containing protein n=1 Tax=viral metagenome TaxID=1070528 RepID=A0A6C0I496_9ZZZZ